MADFGSSEGDFSWTCLRDLDLTSFCTQRSIVDVVNILFLCAFYLSFLSSFTSKNHENGRHRKGWVSLAVSIFCALISIAYFSNGLWDLIAKSEDFRQMGWLVYFFRGLVWISLTVSLLVQRPKSIKILNSAWWVSSCILVSALNIEILFKGLTIQILDMIQWSVHFLLVFCAFQSLYFAPQITQNTTLSKPLLVGNGENKQTELAHANLLSKFTFSWINSLLSLGYSKPLDLEDIPSLVSEDEAEIAFNKFSHAWDSLLKDGRKKKDNKNLVIWSIARVYLKENILIAMCALLRTIAVAASPLVLYAFVNYSNNEEENLKEGFAILGCLILSKILESLPQRHWFFHSRMSGMRMRSALMVAIYKKQLKLSNSARRRHSSGEIVNYIAVDAYRMGDFPWWFHSLWTSSLHLLLAIGVLFGVVGLGALPGLVPLIICGLLNIPFAKIIQKCQSKFMVIQDERLRSTSEILNSMKIIKLQSWEEKFKTLIESLREKEFKWLSKAQFLRAYGTFIYWMSPTMVSSVIFLGCVLFQSAPLNAGTIFTVLATLRSMAEPARMIPDCLSVMIQVKVSFDRLNTFLLDDELNDDGHGIGRNSKEISANSVEIQAGNFTWDQESMPPTLRDLNLEIKWGQKTAVCGPVGAGKSSLLYAILGEIPKTSGNVKVCGTLAYVSQTSWIQSGTIRDNVLFGKPMDKARYENALKVCALDKDINVLSHGDLTEIGQRGINMSGGQKQRIQLARAVYNDADIYLLDDPFSAVDAHTAAILFNDCVMTALRKKTVILVTHQVEFLSLVDKILVMEGGEVTQSGSYEDLLKKGTAFEQLVNAHREAISRSDQNYETQGESEDVIRVIQPLESYGFYLKKEKSEEEISSKGQASVQLTQEEEKEIGDVGWKPFLDYIFLPKGSLLLCLVILAQMCFISLQAASNFWLAVAIEVPKVTNGILIGVYAAISLISSVFVCMRSLFAAELGLKASTSFFSSFNNAIFKAPMLFFDSTPVGRILTRASSDLSILDFDIPYAISFVVSGGTEILITIGIMASVTWQVLIVAVLAIVASKYIQGYYQASSRELMRINGTTKAPVMNFTAETSLGVVTLRAFNMVDRFFEKYLKLVDTDAKLFFHSNAATEWLILRTELLQNLTVFTAALLLVLLPKGFVSSGFAALSLSYALSMTTIQIFLTRWFCNLSNFMVSVERIKQFIHIPEEPPAVVEDRKPPPSWPSKGRIYLQGLEIRYRPNAPLVLKGITCTFKEGSRVGVVGRTGSGKTTLISALFRLVEPAKGDILIDGISICSMGLKDLRMKLSIIPQEPTLFKGSIRTNLDPLGLYSDDEIWKALDKCQLKATISSLPNLLDSSVSDEGENWSVGQRQLFCLGRVLLKRNRILVLDEATASIDSATDAIVQRIIRQEFSECTVITVAHRVPTVVDSDMVMVLSFGKVLEYDEPSKLMETNSSFSKLVAEYWSSCKKNLSSYT
ncbi:ABC transporter C family member 8-like [Senna tora]|uniref:ABC-type xenobiotic transporter n=1 Tax=Senna tora TaxID=362788 RepID=A0A834WCJ7_9FABA|nr:ABC transporter C family member 8-like [Senna tora]